jgi:hypothetical protein
MNFSPETQDPHTLIVDVVNLIEHPRGEKPGEEKKGKPHRLGAQSPQEGKASTDKTSNAVSKDGLASGPASPATEEGSITKPSAGPAANQASNSKAAFRRLFRKYIDNRVLLFIQETRFPRKLDFVLVEPCSQLLWRHHIEPLQITTGLASMHLVDQATLEMFLSVLLDENENCGPTDVKLYEYQGQTSANDDAEGRNYEPIHVCQRWADIKEIKDMKEAAIFVENHELQDCDLTISIAKKREAFNILVRNSSNAPRDENDASDGLDPYNESNGLEIRVNPDGGETQLSKVLRQRGLTYCVLFVKTQGHTTTIKVLQLSPTSIKTVFKFVFEDTPDVSETEYPEEETARRAAAGQIFTSKDL